MAVGLTPLQRFSQCILQLQQTGLRYICVIPRILIVWGSYLSAEMRSVYSTAPTDWDEMDLCNIQNTHWAGSYLSAEMKSVYSTAPANWTEIDWVISRIFIRQRSYLSAELQSVYSTAPAECAEIDWVISWILWCGVLQLCRDTVSVFYSPSRVCWDRLSNILDTMVWGLTALQRCSQCILQPQPSVLR